MGFRVYSFPHSSKDCWFLFYRAVNFKHLMPLQLVKVKFSLSFSSILWILLFVSCQLAPIVLSVIQENLGSFYIHIFKSSPLFPMMSYLFSPNFLHSLLALNFVLWHFNPVKKTFFPSYFFYVPPFVFRIGLTANLTCFWSLFITSSPG